MGIKAVAVVGVKKSGKTTTTEKLIRILTERGFRVATIKHIPEPCFTIDTPGKDTWRHAQAGARTIVSVAADEVATIERVKLETISLEALIRRCRGNDIVFMEGLKKGVSRRKSIPKIVVTKTTAEAVSALEMYKPILAFSGPCDTTCLNLEIPYADALKNPDKLADIVEKEILNAK